MSATGRSRAPHGGQRRRDFILGVAGLAVPLLALRPVRAGVAPTPAQTAGPFYPDELPVDHDADLLRVRGREAAALGEETWISGRVLDDGGAVIDDALVEIWQCDANGRYHHPRDRRAVARDPGFQGYGQTWVDGDGAYRFRTIRPVAYPGRTPHIHFRVSRADGSSLVTQMYVRGEAANARDGILNAVRDAAARERLMVDLQARDGVLHGSFDIVLQRR